MKTNRLASILGLALVLALAGCATPPTAQELAAADYGPPPIAFPEKIKDFMELRLKDPSSAQYRFDNLPTKMWSKAGPLFGGGTMYGWRVDVLINAKNELGGYVGYQQYGFLFRDGRIIAYNERSDLGLNTWMPVR